MEEIKKYILFGLVAALIIGVSIFMLVRRQKIKKNGKTATAVVTRIEEKESFDSDSGTTVSYEYYVTYYSESGENIEARLDNPPRKTNVGDQLTIKYLPEKPNLVVAVKEENK